MSDQALQERVRAAETAEADTPPHYRLPTPRMFKILGMVRRFAGPQARRELGLSDFEWRIMAQVGDRAPMSLNDLAAVSTHDKGQLSRGVKRLVSAGLLIRESRRGERGVFISPTAAGREVYDQLIRLAVRQNQDLVGVLTPEELQIFEVILDKLDARATSLLEKEQELRCEG